MLAAVNVGLYTYCVYIKRLKSRTVWCNQSETSEKGFEIARELRTKAISALGSAASLSIILP